MPLISTLGAMSSRGFGEFAQQTAANYIEDVFSTYLYTGTGSPFYINNGVDVNGYGGLFFIKSRSQNASGNPTGGAGRWVNISKQNSSSNELAFYSGSFATTEAGTNVTAPTWFTTNGQLIDGGAINTSGATYASWTLRKQPKFFDVVTYTGDGAAGQTINHNLGSVPGMIIVKITSGSNSWVVYHRSLGSGGALFLNTSPFISSSSYWNSTNPTATTFTVGNAGSTNLSGATYVAYLFAHDAGGFGADGSQNVISCGSFTCDASGNVGTVSLGYEPQFILLKRTDTTQNWQIVDTMRGMSLTNQQTLNPNLADAEGSWPSSSYFYPTATGFAGTGNFFGPNAQVVYMAIRRGPMRTPTSGTSVFSPNTRTGDGIVTTNFPVDLSFMADRDGSGPYTAVRLTGGNYMNTISTAAETSANWWLFQSNTTFGDNSGIFGPAARNSFNSFQRAPGFFDVACFTGTGSNRTVNHNLTVAPELMIIKRRSSAESWFVYAAPIGNTKYTLLNYDLGVYTDSTFWNNTTPTASVFTLGTNTAINNSGDTYVSYLFASCPGVSKVGSYTGTGATQTISCGFTGGARFVLIKRTDSTGSWWFWDTARGMVAGTDPRLAYNSVAAELNADWVYTTTGGFQIVTSDATVNASGGTYIYLAIA